jgi:N-acetylglucosaminyldiphosphoundecaprenol N-acetyl-beta-D-mannosaminyltransferase
MPEVTAHRLRIGTIWVDALSFEEALREIASLVNRRRGGAVYTPNVDHIMKAESNDLFRRAYLDVSVSLADGMPLVWAARLLGCPLPERVAGSDLLLPLMKLAAQHHWRVYLLGGAPGVAEASAKMLAEQLGVTVVGWDDCRIESDGSDVTGASVTRVRDAKPDLLLVALGPPKQELWIYRAAAEIGPVVALGVGASLDFITGRHRRAPRWMSSVGLEWIFRLFQEPRRLWRRYLLEGPRFVGVVMATWLAPQSERIKERQRILS